MGRAMRDGKNVRRLVHNIDQQVHTSQSTTPIATFLHDPLRGFDYLHHLFYGHNAPYLTIQTGVCWGVKLTHAPSWQPKAGRRQG